MSATCDGADLDNMYAAQPNIKNDEIPLKFLQLGKAAARRLHETMKMRNIMSNLGWTAEITKSHPKINFQTLPVEPVLSALEWKHRVDKKKQEVLEQRKQHVQLLPNQNGDTEQQSPHVYTPNIVKIADRSYLTNKPSDSSTVQHNDMLHSMVEEFSLNVEQEKAFRIGANHANLPYTEPLKALQQFFKVRNESHRFMVVAPTGSAASLLGGSTYHSLFGINDYNEKGLTNLAQV